MSTFLDFLSKHLKDHPLPGFEGYSPSSTHAPDGYTSGSWIFIRDLCREHGEPVFYRQRQLTLLNPESAYPPAHTIYAYLESTEGVCFNLKGPISLKERDNTFHHRSLERLHGRLSLGQSVSSKYRLRVQVNRREPDFITKNTAKITPDLAAWKTDFEKAWLGASIPNHSSIKSTPRL